MNFREQLEAVARTRSETSNSFTYTPSSQEVFGASGISLLLPLEAEVFRPLFLDVADGFTSGALTLASRIELLHDAVQLESTAMYGPDRIVMLASIPRLGRGSITVSVNSHGPAVVCELDRGSAFVDIRKACESRLLEQIQAVI